MAKGAEHIDLEEEDMDPKVKKHLDDKFKKRYEEAYHWIKYHALFQNTGLLNAIAWYLPLIFLEGKVVIAFYDPDKYLQPCFNTIDIPGNNKIFKFEAFDAAIANQTNHAIIKIDTAINNFSLLDYFGFPIPDEASKADDYFCLHWKLKCFGGKLHVWIAAKNVDRYDDEFGLFNPAYHFPEKLNKRLKFYLGKIDELYREELDEKKVKKKSRDMFLYGHNYSNQDHPSQAKVGLTEYLSGALENLHDALVDSLDQKPESIFLLINETLFGEKLYFMFSKNQLDYYERDYEIAVNIIREDTRYKDYPPGYVKELRASMEKFQVDVARYRSENRKKCSKRCTYKTGSSEFILEDFKKGFTIGRLCEALKKDGFNLENSTIEDLNILLKQSTFYERLVKKNKKLSDELEKLINAYVKVQSEFSLKRVNRLALEEYYPQETPKSYKNQCSDIEAAVCIMRSNSQTGVSSFAKQKGLPEIYIEKTSFLKHPLLYKKELIQNDFIDNYNYPEILNNIEPMMLAYLPTLEIGTDKSISESIFEFTIVPFFFRDHPFGCIAFFNPEAKDKDSWFKYLSKIYTLLDEKEDVIYQAAVKDLCYKVSKIFEEKTTHLKDVVKDISDYMAEGLFSGHFFLATSPNLLKRRIGKYYHCPINVDIEFKGNPQDNVITGKKIRGYEIVSATNAKEKIFQLYFACVDSSDHYSPWEKQTDLDVKETIAAGLYAYSLKMEMLRHGTRAAVAAIMGRNMSHNIGSHVLSYWKHELDVYNGTLIEEETHEFNLVANLRNELLTGWCKYCNHSAMISQSELCKLVNDCVSKIKETEPKYEKSIKSLKENNNNIQKSIGLFDYLKNRMDFIAEITTTSPAWSRTMDFVSDILKPFKEGQSALLENIIRSEEFVYGMNFEIDILINGEKTDKNTAGQSVYVSIPHGEVGLHAIFSILENFIRNSAKHGGERLRRPEFLEKNFKDVSELDTLYSNISSVPFDAGLTNSHKIIILNEWLKAPKLYDELSKNNSNKKLSELAEKLVRITAELRTSTKELIEEQKYLIQRLNRQIVEDYNLCTREQKRIFKITIDCRQEGDYIAVTLRDNVGNCNEKIEGIRVIESLSRAISDNKYIDKKGQLIKGKWGLKEIKLSTNFLRMRSTDDIAYAAHDDTELRTRPLLKLNCYDKNCVGSKVCNKEEEANLAFTFFLNIPKEVFIIHNNEPAIQSILINKKLIIELQKCGIEFRDLGKSNIYLRSNNIVHRFLLFSSTKTYQEFKNGGKRYEHLPYRIVIHDEIEHARGKEEREYIATTIKIDWSLLEKNPPHEFIKELYEKYVYMKYEAKIDNIAIVTGGNNKALLQEKWRGIRLLGNETLGVEVGSKKIFFDDHGLVASKIMLSCATGDRYYHPFGTTIGMPFLNVIQHPPKDSIKRSIFACELLEMANLKVVIADERIFRNVEKRFVETQDKSISKPYLRDLLRNQMKVSIVNIQNAQVNENDIYDDVNKGDILVIHQGLIQKMEDKKAFFNKVRGSDHEMGAYKYIVIDSGRGVPEHLEPGTRYIELGTIEKSLQDLDKYSLVQTLLSVRRPTDAK